jgi:Spy/CpxP family protein refolding chaperone
MKNLIIATSLAISLLTFSLSTPVIAGPDHKHHKMHAHHDGKGNERKFNMRRMTYAFSKLDLTEQQKTEIKGLFKQGFEWNKPKRQEMQTLREQMHTLKHAEEIDEQSIRATAASIANLRSDMMIANLQNRKKVEALLSEVQLEKLAEMKQTKKNRRSSGKQRSQ